MLRAPLLAPVALAVSLLCVSGGCAALGMVDDGTTVSWGKANGGGITAPARLPDEGDGYRVPARWRDRGLRYGTDELVDLLIGVSRRVAAVWPQARVTIADLSPQRGGPSQWHRSHQSGRDVDLVFFVTDEAGRAVDPEIMRLFGANGYTRDDKDIGGPRLVFDTARNWSLVRALLEHQGAEVQRIFLFAPLIEMLLDHARGIGEPEAVIARAAELLTQPGDSAPHDDHMHVRIMCSAADFAYGCRDYGRLADDKKAVKVGVATWGTLPAPLRQAVLTQMPAMLALVGLPIRR